MNKHVDHEKRTVDRSSMERNADDGLGMRRGGPTLIAGGRIHRSSLLSGFGMILVLLIGAGASFLAFEASYRAEEERTRLQFHGYASTVLTGVNKELALYFRVLESMGSLYDLSEQISASDFKEFAEKGLGFSRDILGAYGFAQWIPHSYRLLLEEDPDDSFSIMDRGGRGFQTASVRTSYVPLMFQDPPDSLDIPRGFDLARDPEMASAMQRAFARGGPAVGGPLDGGVQAGFYILSPIMTQPQQTPSLIIGMLRLPALLDRVVTDDQTERMQAILRPPLAGEDIPNQPVTTYDDEHIIRLRAALPVADQVLLLECTAQPAWIRRSTSNKPLWILATGGVITTLLLFVFHLLARRTQRIEEVVEQRTRELQASKLELEEVMHERMRLETEILDISSQEQQRMGRDLHDSVGQKLSGSVYMTKALRRQLEAQNVPPELTETAQNLHETLKESVTQIRRMAHGLSPIELVPAGLGDALRRLAREAEEAYGIDCSVQADSEVLPIGRKAATHLYQVAQEAIHNAIRHGKAVKLSLSLLSEATQGKLTITDDGTGFDPEQTTGGMGLRIMRYRAEILEGHFAVSSAQGSGTTITLTFPVKRA